MILISCPPTPQFNKSSSFEQFIFRISLDWWLMTLKHVVFLQQFLQKNKPPKNQAIFKCFLLSLLQFVVCPSDPLKNYLSHQSLQPFTKISQWTYVYLLRIIFWHVSMHTQHFGGYLRQWNSEHGTRAPMFITIKRYNELLTVLRLQQSVITHFY